MIKKDLKKWTDKEIIMLNDPDFTDNEIAEITGKSLCDIKKNRYTKSLSVVNVNNKKLESEIRILKMAKKFNIKLAN